MKKMNKPVVLIVGTLFLAGSAAFAEGTASRSSSDSSGKTLSETTNSGDTSVNMGSTNSEVGGVRPAGQNAGEADSMGRTDDSAAQESMGSTSGSTAVKSKKATMNGKMAKDAHYEGSMKAIPHAAITFEPGSAMLSEASRTSLRDLITEAKAAGDIDQVTVAAWSDKALPTEKGAELPEADRDLAAKRAEAISSVLKTEFDVADVDTFNMAERANWLARTFGTRQAELKSIFAKKDADTPVTNAEFEVIKNQGGPSEAVVVVEREMSK